MADHGLPVNCHDACLGAQARLYYRMYLATQVGDKHLCVVVKLADNDAFVLTAYLVRKPMGGRQLWPKRN